MTHSKKIVVLLLCLALCACLLSGCMILPLQAMTGMLPAESASDGKTVQADGDSVVISREQYERYQQFDQLIEMMDLVDQIYYQDVDHSAMLQGAAAGLLEAIDDPYTFYYTPEEFSKMWEDDEGSYAGVGIQISGNYLTQICTITRVFEDGPAMAAGVKKGDILYKVEDLFVTADTLDEAVSIMRGTPGTDVNVSFIRNGEPFDVVLTRATVQVNRVDHTMLDGGIGYIYLYEFAGTCADEFTAAVKDLSDKGMKGLIIDLRDNGGGWVESARQIGDLFLDAGTLCYLEDKAGNREYTKTTTDHQELQLPMVILVNENTASSSEILSGALQDRAGATVVGTQSFGKGIVQVVVGVGEDGAGMQVTQAQYFTPNGHAVHKIGITPDIVVEMPEDGETMFELGDLNDAQLAAAYEAMQKLLSGE